MLLQQIQEEKILAWSVAPMPTQQPVQQTQPLTANQMRLWDFATSPFEPNTQIENNFFRPQQAPQPTPQQQEPAQQQAQQRQQQTQVTPQPKTQPQAQQQQNVQRPQPTQQRPQTQQPQRQQPTQQTQQPTTDQIWMPTRTERASELVFSRFQKAIDNWKDLTPEEKQAFVEQYAQRRWLQWQEQAIMDMVNTRMQASWLWNVDTPSPLGESNRLQMEKFKSMSIDQMAKAIEMWMIKPWMEIELQGNPNYMEAVRRNQQKKQANIANQIINRDVKIQENPTVNPQEIIDKIGADKANPAVKETIKEIENDDRLTTLSWEISGLDSEIYRLQNEAKRMAETIEKEFPTSISKSALSAITRQRTMAINEELQAKIMEREMKASDYQRVKQEREQQAQETLRQQQQTMNFLMANDGMALLGTPTSQLKQMEDQWLLPRWYADLMANKASSMTAMTLSTLGNVTPEDQKAIQSMLNSWMSPQQVISSLQSTGRFTPQTANAYWFMSLGDGQVAVTNKLTGEVQIMNGRQAQEMAQGAGINMQVQQTLQTFLDKKTDGEVWWHCGAYLNEYMKSVGYGDGTVGTYLTDKLKKAQESGMFTTDWPSEWAMVIMDSDHPLAKDEKWKKYGHVWIVFRWPDGRWMIRDSNAKWDFKVNTRPFDPNNPMIKGYVDPNARMNAISASDFHPTDIVFFNTMTATQRAKERENPKLREFEALKRQVFSDPNASMNDIFLFSEWQKEIWESTLQQVSKVRNALTQVTDIAQSIEKMTTWPIRWRLRQANARDTDAKVLSAQLTAAIPNVARWVYSEVWVLTDADVELYRQTLPNLTNTKDQNKLITAMAIRSIWNNIKNTLQAQARAWRDVSWFVWDYEFIMQQSDALLQQIWQWWTQPQQIQVNIPPHLQFLSR